MMKRCAQHPVRCFIHASSELKSQGGNYHLSKSNSSNNQSCSLEMTSRTKDKSLQQMLSYPSNGLKPRSAKKKCGQGYMSKARVQCQPDMSYKSTVQSPWMYSKKINNMKGLEDKVSIFSHV